MGPSLPAPERLMMPPTREDPAIELAREREAAALRKQRGRMGTLLAGALPPAGDGTLAAPIGGAGATLLGT